MANNKKKPTAKIPANKTIEDLLLDQARESLRQYGTLIPPREAMLPVTRATCPKCGDEGLVMEKFGLRTVNGEVKPQSWCRSCRNSKESHPGRFGLK